jgi:multidrug resistance protein MdtO
LTVTLNRLFLPDDSTPAKARPKPKGLFKPDAFTNPVHAQFALKVTFAAMFCYILYCGIDWAGIHTALITVIFIALESTEATLYKGALRLIGCVIGGAFAILSIVFLIPHMETIASLIVLVSGVTAIAGWIATGSERISYAGFQIAFAFFLSMFQGYAPDTDLDKIRDRVVGILVGIAVTTVIFHYVWPERARLTSPVITQKR